MEAVGIAKSKYLLIDGRSFLPQIRGKEGNSRDWIFCHYEPKWGNWQLKRFVQDKRWKLYHNGNFYDLQGDPLEDNPLKIDKLSEEAKQVKRKIQNILYSFRIVFSCHACAYRHLLIICK